MYYYKFKHNGSIIEFTNDWLGVERVLVNGVKMTEQGSVFGSTHRFSVLEGGHQAQYVMVVRMNMAGQVLLDLVRDRIMLHEAVVASYGSRPAPRVNKSKKLGILQLREYDIDQAIELLNKALDETPNDPEIYFYLACAYSVKEDKEKGFEALEKAIEHNLQDKEVIVTHDKLAYLRIQDEFEAFRDNGYKRP